MTTRCLAVRHWRCSIGRCGRLTQLSYNIVILTYLLTYLLTWVCSTGISLEQVLCQESIPDSIGANILKGLFSKLGIERGRYEKE